MSNEKKNTGEERKKEIVNKKRDKEKRAGKAAEKCRQRLDANGANPTGNVFPPFNHVREALRKAVKSLCLCRHGLICT